MHWQLYAGGSLHVLKHGRPPQREVPGGWACVIEDREGECRTELSGALLTSTIDKMRLLAVVSGLEAIRTLFPDSENSVEIFSNDDICKELARSNSEQRRMDFRKSPNADYDRLHSDQSHRYDRINDDDLRKRLRNVLRTTTVAFTKIRGSCVRKEHEHCRAIASEVRRDLAKKLGYL